jgi:ATP-binding cassette subfamily C protein CydCD
MHFDPRLWQFTAGARGRIWLTVLVGLAAAAAGIARLALLGWLIGLVFAGTTLDELMLPFALVAGAMALRGVLEYARAMVAHGTSARVQLILRQTVYDRIVALGPSYFGSARTGDVVNAMVEGVDKLETYFGEYLPQLIVCLAAPFGIFVFALFLDGPVALVLFGAAVVTLLAPAMFHSWDKRNSLRRSKAYGAFAAEFLDALQGLATLKSFGQSKEKGRQLAAKAHEIFRTTMWVLATNASTRGITDTGIAVGAAAALGLGAWRVSEGAMSIEALVIVLMLGTETFRPLRDLRSLLHQGMMGRSAADKIFSILEAEPLVRDEVTEQARLDGSEIRFEQVSFAYPGAKRNTHDRMDFAIRTGERVGVVGPSGCGKSTILRLLQRQYDPDQGRITIGGVDIAAMPVSQLRSLIAVVQQDSYLFHGSVEDNLRLGKSDATRDEIIAAARAANADDFIRKLPDGYATIVGERGLRLSGGQRQRLAIARALLRDAPILVLDEALSAVDAENEAVIQQALDRLMEGRTTLIFAHRLSSIIGSDRLLVLGEGRVVEEGTHASLIAKEGTYRDLMAAQTRAGDGGDIDLNAALAAEKPRAAADAGWTEEGAEGASDILSARELGWFKAAAMLMAEVRPWRTKLFWTFVFGVVRTLAFIGIGALSALVLLAVKNGEPFGDLLIALAVAAPTAGILHWLESWLAHDMAFRMLSEMRIALFRKLDSLAPAFLLRRRSGDVVGLATHDVEMVEYFFAHTIAPAFVSVLVPTLVVGVLAWFDWRLAAALLPFLVAVALFPVLWRKRIDRLGTESREVMGDLNAFSVDCIQGLSEILAFQAEGPRRDALNRRSEKTNRLRLPFFSDISLQAAILEAATGFGGLVVVIAGAASVGAGRIEAGVLPLMSLLAMAAFLPVSEIAAIGRQLADTLGATRRLHAVHNEPEPVTDGPVTDLPPAPGGGATVTAEHVTFTYPDRTRPALTDVGFTIAPGQTLAIVGPSGAGKTTIAHLLMRFWDPEAGRITLDGHDIRELDLDLLRDRIALVAQDTFLFNDTLEANIRLARPDASDAELRAAIERAALADYIDGLPDGLATPAGERGVKLSGGQRQRIAIARAFLKDAPVLILDEATSHLDAISEKAVRAALAELMQARTTIVIAHRLSTIRDADVILVLDDGHAVECGSHDELVAEGGLYARLVARQTGKAAAE